MKRMLPTFFVCSRTRTSNTGALISQLFSAGAKNLAFSISEDRWAYLTIELMPFYLFSFLLNSWYCKETKSVSFSVVSTYEVWHTFILFALLRTLTIAWFAGSWLWPRFLEVTIAKGSFRIRMGYIAVQRAGLCPLHCWTWEGSGSRNCIHVLVRGYGCKFVSSPCIHTVVET